MFRAFACVLVDNQQKGNKPWTQTGSYSRSNLTLILLFPLSLQEEPVSTLQRGNEGNEGFHSFNIETPDQC